LDDPSWNLFIYVLLAVSFIIYARYYNSLHRLTLFRGAMLVNLIEKEELSPEEITHYESKLFSLQIGRLVFLVPLLSSFHFLPFTSFPLFLTISCVVVFLGEIFFPGITGIKYQGITRFSSFEIRFINLLSSIFMPVTFLILTMKEIWFRMRGKKIQDDSEHWLENEISSIIKAGEQEGIFKETEKELLKGIIDFRDTIVREVMTPRTDIVFISSEDSIKTLRQLIVKAGHSRIPVFQEKIDNIIGIVFAKDILTYEPGDMAKLEVKTLMRQPIFIPETKKVRELLTEFKEKKIHMAIVVDEYGGVAGLVTIEDLIEEIVGEIRDEYDQEAEFVEELKDGNLLVDAKSSIDLLQEHYNIEILRDDFDTIGGFVIDQLGRVPKTGENVFYENLVFEIMGADARRIKKIKIMKTDMKDKVLGTDES